MTGLLHQAPPRRPSRVCRLSDRQQVTTTTRVQRRSFFWLRKMQKSRALGSDSGNSESQIQKIDDDVQDGTSAVQDEDTLARLTLWQKLGQSFNASGIGFFAKVALQDPTLALPHLEVQDLGSVPWKTLREAGFFGCIFDKDNTLTEPYKLDLEPSAAKALEECREVFSGNIALYSNSAGLLQFDPEGEEASALESALGIPVMRHKKKKPAGDAEDIEKHFGCEIHKIIMVGDRYLTDIAFGNRLKMLTIRQKPYTNQGEPSAVRAARVIEEKFVSHCLRKGLKAPDHQLIELDKIHPVN